MGRGAGILPGLKWDGNGEALPSDPLLEEDIDDFDSDSIYVDGMHAAAGSSI